MIAIDDFNNFRSYNIKTISYRSSRINNRIDANHMVLDPKKSMITRFTMQSGPRASWIGPSRSLRVTLPV